jgi:prepilin-type N-terminal cleavage/methylation domain-containing protein
MSARHASHHAFSLIEMMIVIAIISVVAAIALPRYSNSLQQYRATLAAKRIAADLHMAQFRARSLSTSRTITFTLAGSSYQIPGETDFKNSLATYTVSLGDAPYFATINSAQFGSVASVGSASVSFNGFGMPSGAGSITLSSGNVTKIITLAAQTGAISIQ